MPNHIKNILKSCVDTLLVIMVIPLLILYGIWAALDKADKGFWGISQFLSLFPGILGNYLRKNFYRFTMTRCNKNCAILFGTLFSQVDTEIGRGVYIGPNCNIGKSKISDHCTLGSNVHIMSGKNQHHFESLEIPIQQQGGTLEKIVIGEDTWIGNGAMIMANVGKKCIVGSGAVITKDVEDFSVVAGNPAILIRKRDDE